MSPILSIIVAISLLFVLHLLVKQVTGWRYCAICASVSLTWLGLLALYWLGRFDHPALIGVLMGQSVVGVYYLLEKKVPEAWHVFRLPYLLTTTVVVYALLGLLTQAVHVFGTLAVLWIVFGVAFVNSRSGWAKKIVACCKNW
ncbi:MAG: hypothetical protein COU35_04440 [Candidatus Magasanikbacteria bacterium CG10_big_fil_rev_8_21_14_0_10_47_10]|uniref:Uncharacterized protein n=1 Tax=Candidatus Magasanikbacteria bacterium CG10_big_fil_rev_8_21_14_0_10_47_10 TaxID=1974652 RepID=A0A2H0TPH4_9BACT|nr:MAG: hypothetical protein COU35_04440 [Candidatus Magasanikbacteria bacterium CG10_big_fil_rev_8_21_14_0_10_47_10]